MKNRKIIYFGLTAVFVLALVLVGIIFYSRSQELKIIFLDVGQGDAILIEQGSQQILIDGGPNGQIMMNKIGKYIPFWDRKIELVIATHPDADHITGLIEVIKNYQIGALMKTETTSDTRVFQRFQEVIQQKNIQIIKGEYGNKISMSKGARMEILNPEMETPIDAQDANFSSIVIKLIFGENSFLLTGDLPSERETELIEKELDLSAKILKVAHHGSKHSTSAEFLKKVNPRESVISVGKNNRYGHPNAEVLDRLKSFGIKFWRTDEVGDIAFKCINSATQCRMVVN